MGQLRSVAIVGAGLAGLACAQALQAAGRRVTLFDKGTQPGGRMATRRSRTRPDLAFNHGAQYLTARDPGFADLVAHLAEAGVAAPWQADWAAARLASQTRWVGVPGMAGIPGHLAAGLAQAGVALHLGDAVTGLRRDADGWRLDHGAAADAFDALLLAVPAPQAAALLAGVHPAFAADAARAVMAPCWALMLGFDQALDIAPVQRPTLGPLGWIAVAQPGAADRRSWVAHATPAWSRANLERDAPDVAADLLAAFRDATDARAETVHLAAHRWRYAMVETPLGTPCRWDDAAGLGLCADWCIGPRVEAAFLSGRALAAQVVAA